MKILRLAPALLLVATSACVSSSDMELAQQQIAELQEELANIKRNAAGKEDVQNVNTRIAEQTETLLKSNATLVTKVGEMDDRMQSTQGAVEQVGYRVDRAIQQITQAQRDITDLQNRVNALQAAPAPSPGTVPGTSTPGAGGTPAVSEVTVPAPPSTDDPMQVYQAAYRDYQRGNYDLAIEGFREFVAGNANSELADNASYWIGESLFSQKKYREAIQQFDTVVTKYPRSDKVPGALLKKGYSYISIGERSQGVVQLQYVIHEHPNSQEASLARQRLKALGIETR